MEVWPPGERSSSSSSSLPRFLRCWRTLFCCKSREELSRTFLSPAKQARGYWPAIITFLFLVWRFISGQQQITNFLPPCITPCGHFCTFPLILRFILKLWPHNFDSHIFYFFMAVQQPVPRQFGVFLWCDWLRAFLLINTHFQFILHFTQPSCTLRCSPLIAPLICHYFVSIFIYHAWLFLHLFFPPGTNRLL